MRLLPDNFQFEQPHWFWALLLIPLLAFLKSFAGEQSVVQFGSLHLLQSLGRRTSSAMGRFGIFLVYLTIAAGVTALARPQKFTAEEKVEESGVEIFFALDLSLSMSIRDMYYEVDGQKKTVNRLVVLKNVVKNFIRNRPTDRIGFVVFAGKPYLASPLTLDTNWLQKTLEDIGFEELRRSTDNMGTAIGSAIATAATRLTSKDSKSKIIILVTDGANNSGRLLPPEAARHAAKLGIKIYAVAIGTYGHHIVPELTGSQYGGGGNDIRQEFDEKTLKEVADITGGRFFHAKDSTAMDNIFSEIDRLEKTKLIIRRSTLIDELYHWPLWGAVISGFLTLILHHTLLRRYP